MRVLRIFVCFTVAVSAFCLPVMAADSGQYEAIGAEDLEQSLEPQTAEILERLKISYDSTEPVDAGSVLQEVGRTIKENIGKPIAAMAAVIAMAALQGAISAADLSGGTKQAMSLVTAVAIGCMCILPLSKAVVSAAEAVKSCGVFMLALVPVYGAAIMCSGYASAAGSFSAVTVTAAELIVQAADRLIIPLCRVMLCIATVGTVGFVNFGGILNTVKKCSTWVLGGAMTLFTAILGIQTAISGAADGMALRTAKYMTGTFVPVVGSAVSETLSVVGASIGMLKTSVGIFGLAAVAVMLLPPIISLSIWRIALELSGGCCDAFELKREADMLRSVSSVIGIMVAVLICTAVMFIVSLAIVSQVVKVQ